jgi:endonuclease/exonuclease/phosphatase (EEP) superfamily protein YafD
MVPASTDGIPDPNPPGVVTRLSALAASAIALVIALGQVLGLRDGPMGLVAVFAPHLLLAAAALAVFAVLRARWTASFVSLAIVLVVGTVTLGADWVPGIPAVRDGPTMRLMSWNLELGSAALRSLPDVLGSTDVDVVALQELTPEAAAMIEADAAITAAFPYRLLVPAPGVVGMGLLSRFRLDELERTADPPTLAGELDIAGHAVRVLNAHPLPGRIATVSPLRIPVAFDPSDRDADLRTIRTMADGLAAAGAPLVLLGDLNVAPTEPAFDDVLRGWRDAHAEVGVGPGWTWRPSRLEGLGIGLLRIDYVLVSAGLAPIDIGQDCSRPGDHCIVRAELGFGDR